MFNEPDEFSDLTAELDNEHFAKIGQVHKMKISPGSFKVNWNLCIQNVIMGIARAF